MGFLLSILLHTLCVIGYQMPRAFHGQIYHNWERTRRKAQLCFLCCHSDGENAHLLWERVQSWLLLRSMTTRYKRTGWELVSHAWTLWTLWTGSWEVPRRSACFCGFLYPPQKQLTLSTAMNTPTVVVSIQYILLHKPGAFTGTSIVSTNFSTLFLLFCIYFNLFFFN